MLINCQKCNSSKELDTSNFNNISEIELKCPDCGDVFSVKNTDVNFEVISKTQKACITTNEDNNKININTYIDTDFALIKKITRFTSKTLKIYVIGFSSIALSMFLFGKTFSILPAIIFGIAAIRSTNHFICTKCGNLVQETSSKCLTCGIQLRDSATKAWEFDYKSDDELETVLRRLINEGKRLEAITTYRKAKDADYQTALDYIENLSHS